VISGKWSVTNPPCDRGSEVADGAIKATSACMSRRVHDVEDEDSVYIPG
jgi:hypothetical protein